ncbi:MAG: hypothetical protein AAF732_13195 [Pseudomonadota bacterium]
MKHEFQLFADYHQVHLQDDDIAHGDLSEAWLDDQATERGLAVTEHAIAIGTARSMDVPVSVAFGTERPVLDSSEFDKINETILQIDTGRLVVMGCTDDFDDAARIICAPGRYGVVVAHKDLDSLSADGLDGNDSYHVFLWPR